jgi:hypothetical protein
MLTTNDLRHIAGRSGALEKIRLTNDSNCAALEGEDRRPIRKNKTRSNRRPSV